MITALNLYVLFSKSYVNDASCGVACGDGGVSIRVCRLDVKHFHSMVLCQPFFGFFLRRSA